MLIIFLFASDLLGLAAYMCLAQVKFRPEPVRVLETFFSWKKLQPDICFYRVGGAEKHFGPKCVLAHLFLPNLLGNGKSVLFASKCFFFFVAPTLKRTGYHYQWGPYWEVIETQIGA